MPFAFTPTDGYRNTTDFPTTPASETAFRDAMQDLLDQLRDYINSTNFDVNILRVASGILVASPPGNGAGLDIQVGAEEDVYIFRSTGYSVKFNKLTGMMSIGGVDVALKQPTTAAWIAPTLLNGWVNYGTPQATAGYYKDDMGIVRLRGLIKSGTTAAGTSLLTPLPSGYRPKLHGIFPGVTFNGATVSLLSLGVLNDGTVQINNGTASSSWLSLDGIAFRAEQ